MNVAVKALGQGVWIPVLFPRVSVTKIRFYVTSLFVAVLLSAFSVIYVKDVNRRFEGHLQMLQNSAIHMQMQWSRLLLEKGTWSSKARVEKIAHNRLGMMVPKAKAIITV